MTFSKLLSKCYQKIFFLFSIFIYLQKESFEVCWRFCDARILVVKITTDHETWCHLYTPETRNQKNSSFIKNHQKKNETSTAFLDTARVHEEIRGRLCFLKQLQLPPERPFLAPLPKSQKTWWRSRNFH